jgi:hypothetical protein
VIDRNLDENDPDAVRIVDPHLGQSPGLGHGLSENTHADRRQPFVLSTNVSHLEPDHQRARGGTRSLPGHFQQSRAEKEHHSRVVRRAELPVDRQTQHVPVETAAPVQVRWPQQNPAAQYLHITILAAPSGRWPERRRRSRETAAVRWTMGW